MQYTNCLKDFELIREIIPFYATGDTDDHNIEFPDSGRNHFYVHIQEYRLQGMLMKRTGLVFFQFQIYLYVRYNLNCNYHLF